MDNEKSILSLVPKRKKEDESKSNVIDLDSYRLKKQEDLSYEGPKEQKYKISDNQEQTAENAENILKIASGMGVALADKIESFLGLEDISDDEFNVAIEGIVNNAKSITALLERPYDELDGSQNNSELKKKLEKAMEKYQLEMLHDLRGKETAKIALEEYLKKIKEN
jgi:hypothetical protein